MQVHAPVPLVKTSSVELEDTVIIPAAASTAAQGYKPSYCHIVSSTIPTSGLLPNLNKAKWSEICPSEIS